MIAVEDILYVRYAVPDLNDAQSFMTDFGLVPSARTDTALYMRGAGEHHHVYVAQTGQGHGGIGFGMLATSAADLERVAADAGARVEANQEPGGGSKVTLTDPAGNQVDILHGLAKLPPLALREPVATNPYGRRARFNRTVRLAGVPAHIARLGHVAIYVPSLAQAIAFYSGLLGMKVADSYYAGAEDNRIAAFMRCGLGARFTDHHTVALVQMPKPGFDHASWEVLDWDDLMIGHDYLRRTGKYQHSWGVGRHYDGSNIFDYWRDPFGNKVERFTDGDAVNDDYVPSNSAIDLADPGKLLAMWGPPLTADFMA